MRGAALVKASASETASILNDPLNNHWRAFEHLKDAKIAASALYRRTIAYLAKKGRPTEELKRRLAELPHLTIKQLPSVHAHVVGRPL